MKVIAIKKERRTEFLPLNGFPNKIKNNTFEYFIYGKGYKKTKNFKILDSELPDNLTLSWIEICKIHEKYGIEVSNEYAERKVAGIISKLRVYTFYNIYTKIKQHIPENFNERFFECLCSDHFFACIGLYMFDICATDKKLSELDPEYDNENCTYKGENISMKDYIEKKYGKQYSFLIELLCSEAKTV